MRIRKASIEDIDTLEKVIVDSFLVPHGHAAPKKLIENYIALNFNKKAIESDISDPKNEYRILEYKDQIVGFSKVIFNYPNENITDTNVAKMERIYLLKEFYGLNLGRELFQYNMKLAKENDQNGMWLHVWIENKRAIKFYEKMGMRSVGSYDFPVSENYTNENHVMFVRF